MGNSVLTGYCFYSIAIAAIMCAGKPASGQFAGAAPSQSSSEGLVAGKLSPSQLEELLAPIALYPDVLISQILPASTYPIEIVQAARWLKKNPDLAKVDEQGWPPSVSALCRYSDVVSKMDQDLDWTQALGVAFTVQSEDVMDAIQRLRRRAEAVGSLSTTAEQTIVIDSGLIRVVPTQANVVYVPRYDPVVVYVDDDDDDAAVAAVVGFSAGLALGAWLDTDCDWHHGHVYHCAPGYWGGWHHHGRLRFDDAGFVAGVGPRRAFVAGEHRGAYVGPHGGAVWGEHGRGAVWTRHRPYRAPAYTGRYATQGNHSRSRINRSNYSNRSNNQVTINRNKVNIDRGDRTAANRRTDVAQRDRRRPPRRSTGRSETNRTTDRSREKQPTRQGASSRRSQTNRDERDRTTSRRPSSGNRSSFGDHRGGRSVSQDSRRGHSSRTKGMSGRRGGGRRR